MIALASGVRVYLACGITDMRRGMTGLAMMVQQGLARSAGRGGQVRSSSAEQLTINSMQITGVEILLGPTVIDAEEPANRHCRLLRC